jgi:hypothetical protein
LQHYTGTRQITRHRTIKNFKEKQDKVKISEEKKEAISATEIKWHTVK